MIINLQRRFAPTRPVSSGFGGRFARNTQLYRVEKGANDSVTETVCKTSRLRSQMFQRVSPLRPSPETDSYRTIRRRYRVGRRPKRELRFDPEQEAFPGDEEANRLLTREYHPEFQLSVKV